MASKWSILDFIIKILQAFKILKPKDLNLDDLRPSDAQQPSTKVEDVD